MLDVGHALDALSNALGLGALAFDDAGNLTLVLDGATLVNLHRLNDTSFEIWTRLDGLGNTGDSALLADLLVANHLGEGTGAARLALTPDRSAVVLCERLSVIQLDSTGLEARFSQFLDYVAFWESPQARQSTRKAELPAAGEYMIRA